MLLFGFTTIAVSLVTNYAVMVGVLFLVGLVIAPPQIVAATLMQRHVPGNRLGRASGAQGTVVNVANIASMGVAGLLMDSIGARPVFTLSGIIISSAGIVTWWVLRGVPAEAAEIDSHPHIPPPPETAKAHDISTRQSMPPATVIDAAANNSEQIQADADIAHPV